MLRYDSIDKIFLNKILSLDLKKRSLPQKDGNPYFTFTTTSQGNMLRFLDGLDEQEDDEGN